MQRGFVPSFALFSLLFVACGARTGDADLFGDSAVSLGRNLPGTDAPSGGQTGEGGGTGQGECCTVSAEPSCSDPEISECVCAGDPYCCYSSWDTTCVERAVSECGACQEGSGGSGGGPTVGVGGSALGTGASMGSGASMGTGASMGSGATMGPGA
ncbi:MAG: hypothetical protein MK135_16910, partial [Polyangiaceae bacterium]|nr:hypothetical protein [Polyangiaceae bacterium]